VLGALVPGPVRTLAVLRPLLWLGEISYGLYLVHWPVLVALRHVAPEPNVLEDVLAVGIAVALAWLSAQLVELPVRRRVVRPRDVATGAAALALVLVVALVVPGQTSASQELLDQLAAAHAAVPTTAAHATVPTTAAATIADRPASDGVAARTPPPQVELLGDSVAFSLSRGLDQAAAEARFHLGPGEFELGCGIALAPGHDPARDATCAGMVDRMVADIPARHIDVVVVGSCQWELLRQPLPRTTKPRIAGDPVFDAYVHDAYRDMARRLRTAGAAKVLWIKCAPLSQVVQPDDLGPEFVASRDPARTAAINRIVDQLAAEGDIGVLDLAAWVAPRADDPTLRPDGSHFAWDQDTGVAQELTRLINDAVG
jgi:hypothetical protein